MAGYRNENHAYNGAEQAAVESDFNLEVIAFNIIRNWWIILLGCIIVAMFSYVVVSERYKPKFYAEATLAVTSKSGGSDPVYSNLVVASKLAESFTYVIESPVLQQKIAQSLGNDEFSGKVTAKNIESTNILQIGVEADSPKLAFDEICGIIKYHGEVSEGLLGNAVLDVLKAPTVPTEPKKEMNRPGRILKYTLLAAAGIIAILAVDSVVSDQVMTEKDLETKIDCPALATIYHERKNLSLRAKLHGVKTSMLITNPTTSFRFAETYRLFRTRLEYLMKQKDYKVLMVSSVHENEGKTTSAANTSITLALNNKKVLLIDGDMLKPALYKIMTTRVKRGKAINEMIEQEDVSMDQIPTLNGLPNLSLLMGRSELSNSTEIISSNAMRDFIKKARDYFDYIVIDTPPIALATDAECFAELADCMLLVIKQGGARAKRINDSIDAVKRSGAEILGCIFNNVYPLEFFSMPDNDEKTFQNYRTAGGYGFNDERRGGYANNDRGGYGSGEGARGYAQGEAASRRPANGSEAAS